MYNEYFGLREAPFSIAPNPSYLYMSERHREALAHLMYGIKSDGGFILLTGEVGTGKTTVCRCLLEQIPEDVNIAFVLNPKLDSVEMLATVCDELGISYPLDATGKPSIKVLVDNLNRFLLSAHEQGKKTVLIIDEAQNLAIDVLEQLRLLTNLETNKRKLLQIILLGQPELLDLLATRELRQLSQRVTARFHLDALTRAETADYIAHRLEIAGARHTLFPPKTINKIYQRSGGIPRLINLICDRSLLGTFSEEKSEVDSRIVNRASIEILGKAHPKGTGESGPAKWLLPVFTAALAVMLAITATLYWTTLPKASTTETINNTQTTATNENPAKYAQNPPPNANEWLGLLRSTTSALSNPDTNVEQSLASLTQVVGDNERDKAMRPLLVLWGATVGPDQTDICKAIAAAGLDCLTTAANLATIARINRPVTLDIGNETASNWVALVALDERTATLIAQGQQTLVARESLSGLGVVNILAVWRTPPGWRGDLKLGDTGASVDWLVSQLALLNGIVPETQPGYIFDPQLESDVKAFQKSRGLPQTGIVDANTWIQLNSLSSEGIPFLQVTGAS